MNQREHSQLPGLPRGVRPYDWALKQLRIAQAHDVTLGSRKVVVAVIDLGYRHHPDLDGHLWRNPRPRKGDLHGWDFFDNDVSLEYTGPEPDSTYHRGHHVFVAGEVAATAPLCRIMIVRVGYGNPDSWWRGIRYAVDHGARILVIPHGYIAGERAFGDNLFHKGTDFTYPFDNPKNREALDYAYDRGCLIVRGTCDNRGRRVAYAESAFDTVFAVGSTNRHDEPADICCSADYVDAGAPGGQRNSKDEREQIWGCGGDGNYIPFTGGCMASGFGGGVAALVWSRFPILSNDEVCQVLRNTARPSRGVTPDADGWEPRLGYGILDSSKAVSLKPQEFRRDLRIVAPSVKVVQRRGRHIIEARLENRGVFDAERAIAVVYNGNPVKPVDPSGTLERPAPILQTKQVGHSITAVRGFHQTPISIVLSESPGATLWVQVYCLDRHDLGNVRNTALRLK